MILLCINIYLFVKCERFLNICCFLDEFHRNHHNLEILTDHINCFTFDYSIVEMFNLLNINSKQKSTQESLEFLRGIHIYNDTHTQEDICDRSNYH